MRFSEFAKFLDKLEGTSGRNEMTVLLADFLKKLEGEEIRQALYLMSGRVAPFFTAVEFGFSQKLALRSIATFLAGGDEDKVNKLFKTKGDVGSAAEEIVKVSGKGLSIGEVFGELEQLAKLEGKGSQEGKLRQFGELLKKLGPIEARYVSRVVVGNLRLGLSAKTVQDALSWAVTGDKSLRDEIERAFGSLADIGEIATIVLRAKSMDEVKEQLANVKLKPGVPVASKLVEREKTAEAVFKRLGNCVAQPKLDGLRAQIHYSAKDDIAEVFSRNMESLTSSFPDLVGAVKKLGVKSAIIDSEAIGYDKENDTYLPFQETMQRRRKYDIESMAESIPVKAMAFDLLYLDGEDLTRQSLSERLAKLRDLLASKPSGSKQEVIDMLDSPTIDSTEKLEEYFSEQVGKGLEGIIVKKLGTPYEPGTRNFDWIKLKANTRSELVDTVDTVVLGYFAGRGVRAKFGVGALLVGVYDEADGKFYSVAKVGTGMKDEDWKTIKTDLGQIETSTQPDNVVVDKILHPDVWVRPEIVMEIDADEITRSPSHTAARELKASFEKDTKGKGLSLRFPRMKVWKRDKKAEQATSVRELLRLFELRKG